MQSHVQQLKAYGHLPNVSLADVGLESAYHEIHELQLVFLSRQCGHPDAYDEEIANAEPLRLMSQLSLPTVGDAKQLSESHKRIAQPYNNAKWPRDCHTDYPGVNAVKMFVDWESFERTPNWRATTIEDLKQITSAGVWPWSLEELSDVWEGEPLAKVARWWADQAWLRVGVLHVQIQDGVNGSEHQIHVTAKPIPGSTIGVGWFPSGSCSDHVNQHIDTIRFSLTGLTRLFTHEDGHNHGEPHQFTGQSRHRGVMSYQPPAKFYGFSPGTPPYPLPLDPTLPSLLEKYGGPIEDPTVPEEPEKPTPPVPDRELFGRLTILETGETLDVVRPITEQGTIQW